MFKLPKWALPNNYPAFYDTESATAIEMTAKLYGAMSSFADEYNKFADDINKAIDEFVAKGAEDYLVFQMKMEQLYSDFVKVVELKYQSQDVYLQSAVAQIIAELPDKLAETLDNMYTSGEFDNIVYNSIANLKADFDRIVANNNTFQSNINKSFSNLVTDVESFKQSTAADFNELSAALNAKFDELVLDAQSADMQKAIYDKNNSGVVDDAEKLGGQLPAYYAKQQDLDTTNANMETLNISVNSTILQIETTQNTATSAKTTADAAKTSADSALSQVGSKLGVTQTAADSSKLGGRPAGDYALNVDAINEYTHAKTGIIHYLNGTGNNIKFFASADWNAGDILYVNGVKVHCYNSVAERLENEILFKANTAVTCTLGTKYMSGDEEVQGCFFKLGGTGNDLNFSVVGGTTQPVSPTENMIWVNTNVPITSWYMSYINNPNWIAPTGRLSICFESAIDSTVNSFNALKKQEMYIKITGVKHSDGTGAWYSKDAYIYLNGEWKQISTVRIPVNPYVLQLGLDTQSDYTGGWGINQNGDYWYFAGYDASNKAIRFSQSSRTGHSNGWCFTQKKVNISGWNKLIMRVTTRQGYGDADKSPGWSYVCLSNSQNAPMSGTDQWNSDVVKGTFMWYNNVNETEHYVIVDISGITGEFYIVAGQRVYYDGKTFTVNIHDIYFE